MKYSNTDVLVAEMKNLEFNFKHEDNEGRCQFCWQKHCDHTVDVDTYQFLNSPNNEVTFEDELLYA
jgi:hypothetical protein